MRTMSILGAAVAGLALLLSACSSDDGDATGRALGVTGVPDGAPFVDQDNLRFIPGRVTVELGETVYFKNSESALHTVTLDNQNLSGSMSRNDIFQWNPPAVGSYDFKCDFHPQMRAIIEVVETLPEGTVTADG